MENEIKNSVNRDLIDARALIYEANKLAIEICNLDKNDFKEKVYLKYKAVSHANYSKKIIQSAIKTNGEHAIKYIIDESLSITNEINDQLFELLKKANMESLK